MEVEIIQKSKDILSVMFSYKNQYVNVNRWVTLNVYVNAENQIYIKSWIDICNKTFFKGSLPGVLPVFWNDEQDTNFVCTQFMNDNYLTVVRIPFEECRNAFEKVRDAYQHLISEKIKNQPNNFMTSQLYRNTVSTYKCAICLHLKSQ